MSRKRFFRANDVATLIGVSASTIRNYQHQGKLPDRRTPGNQRYFLQEDVDRLLGIIPEEKAVFYTRSSSGSKTSLENQEKLLSDLATPTHVYKERGSGLSEKRPQLQRLIKHAQERQFNTLYVTEPDRLSRFGRTWIEQLLEQNGVKIIYGSEPDREDLQSELLRDFMSLIASFSGRFYRLRGKEQKLALIELARKEVEK
jgi:putative resolvase